MGRSKVQRADHRGYASVHFLRERLFQIPSTQSRLHVPDGMRSRNAAIAAAQVVVVSPAQAPYRLDRAKYPRKQFQDTRGTSAGDCAWVITLRSKSAVRLKERMIWSSISRCCAVTQTSDSKSDERRCSSSTTGAILIASGRFRTH